MSFLADDKGASVLVCLLLLWCYGTIHFVQGDGALRCTMNGSISVLASRGSGVQRSYRNEDKGGGCCGRKKADFGCAWTLIDAVSPVCGNSKNPLPSPAQPSPGAKHDLRNKSRNRNVSFMPIWSTNDGRSNAIGKRGLQVYRGTE